MFELHYLMILAIACGAFLLGLVLGRGAGMYAWKVVEMQRQEIADLGAKIDLLEARNAAKSNRGRLVHYKPDSC